MCNDSTFDIHSTLEIARDTVGIVALVFFFFGTPLNAIICILGYRISQKDNYASHVLVVSLSCADLLLTAVHSPMQFGKYALDVRYGLIPCRIYFYSTYIGTMSSSLSLLMLNADKLLHVQFPLHYNVLVTPFRLKMSLIVCWIISLIGCGVFLHEPGTKFVNSSIGCAVDSSNIYTYTTFTTVWFIVPNVLSFLFSCRTIYVIYKRKRGQRLSLAYKGRYPSGKLRMHVGSMVETSQISQVDGSPRRHPLLGKKGERGGTPKKRSKDRTVRYPFGVATLLVFSTTIWSTCTVLPYRILFIIVKAYDLVRVPTCATGHQMAAYMLLVLLLPLNAVVNPLITLVTQRVYCRALNDARTSSKYSGSVMSQQASVVVNINSIAA